MSEMRHESGNEDRADGSSSDHRSLELCLSHASGSNVRQTGQLFEMRNGFEGDEDPSGTGRLGPLIFADVIRTSPIDA